MISEKHTKIIETERLVLRLFKIEDAQQMFNNWASIEEVTEHLTWFPHKSVEETRELIKIWLKEYEEEYSYRWVVSLKETDEIIGGIDVVRKSIRYLSCEIGYCYGPAWWGKGYGTEALKAVIEHLHEIGFIVITAEHSASNPASGKIMEKAGMKYDGTLPLRIINKKDLREDMLIYSSIKD